MANEQITKFLALLEKDAELQNKLRKADEIFAKEHKSAEKNEAIEAIVLPIAKEAGFTFTAEEFEKGLKQARSELDENELANISGGWGFCLLIGGSGEELVGVTTGSDGENGYIGAMACKYIGVGFGVVTENGINHYEA